MDTRTQTTRRIPLLPCLQRVVYLATLALLGTAFLAAFRATECGISDRFDGMAFAVVFSAVCTVVVRLMLQLCDLVVELNNLRRRVA